MSKLSRFIKSKLLSLLAPKYIGSFVRHGLGILSAFLLGKGFGEAAGVLQGWEPQITAFIYALIQSWSLMNKKD